MGIGSFSMVSIPLYVVRRGEMLYFRMRIPKDLRDSLGMTEIVLSLGTNRSRVAGRKAQRLAWSLPGLINDIRKGRYPGMKELTKEEIRKLVTGWVKEALKDDEQERALRKRIKSRDEIDHDGNIYEFLLHDMKENLATGNHKGSFASAEDLLEEQGYTVDSQSDTFRILCREMVKGQIEVMNVVLERERGEYRDEPFIHHPDHAGSAVYQTPPEVSAPKEAGPLLSVILDQWVKDKLSLKEWTVRTENDNVPMIRDFIEMVGDMPVGLLSAEDMRDARERFLRIPKNRTKNPKYKNFSIRELSDMEIPEGERLSRQTLHNRAIKIGGFLKWSRERGYPLDEKIETVMKFKVLKRKALSTRGVFSPEDLAVLFSPINYLPEMKGKAERYWVPLISLITGMRIEEICQLATDDIRTVGGIPCIDINTKEEKRLKTLASRRLVPVSPLLGDLGFLAYVEYLTGRGSIRCPPLNRH